MARQEYQDNLDGKGRQDSRDVAPGSANSGQEIGKKERLLRSAPKGIASVVRDKTFIVQAELTQAGREDNDENAPLYVYSKFSRFVLAIINGERKSATANIKVTDVPGIRAASDFAYRMHMEHLYMPKQTPGSMDNGDNGFQEILRTPAFTRHMTIGHLVGTSPAAFIINAADREEAVRHLDTLCAGSEGSNAGADENRIGAIKQAIKLYKDGALTDGLIKRFRGAGTNSPAFIKRFTSGNMKGKTAAEVITGAEDAEAAITSLKSQYKWLDKNAKSNPKYAANNREQMKAIEEAVNLYRDGRLCSDAPASPSSAEGLVIPIYSGGFRPLRSRGKKNGKTFVYELKISWSIGTDYPVTIEIKNYYAEVVTRENGTLNVQVKTKEHEQKNTMCLTAPEWLNVIAAMEMNMRIFEQRYGNSCISAADRAKWEAREAAGLTDAHNSRQDSRAS